MHCGGRKRNAEASDEGTKLAHVLDRTRVETVQNRCSARHIIEDNICNETVYSVSWCSVRFESNAKNLQSYPIGTNWLSTKVNM